MSVDSLIPEKFHQITNHNCLEEILAGIAQAQTLKFKEVKINVVLLQGINIDEVESFIEATRNSDVSIRFIELMQTGTNLAYFQKHHIKADFISTILQTNGWQPVLRQFDAGPAVEYQHANYQGKIGIIAPYSKDFCTTCNRLRVSAKGELGLCLFGNIGYSLRHLLQSDQQLQGFKNFIIDKLPYKLESHYLQEGNTGMNNNFASIGG